MVASAWIYLRTMGVSVRVTLLLCALLSLYPDVLLSMNKVIDTNVTAALLFGFVTTLMFVVRGGGADALAGRMWDWHSCSDMRYSCVRIWWC
jgi:hypothetical protein